MRMIDYYDCLSGIVLSLHRLGLIGEKEQLALMGKAFRRKAEKEGIYFEKYI